MPTSTPLSITHPSAYLFWQKIFLFSLSICILLSLSSTDSLTAATLTPIYLIQGTTTVSPLYEQWIDTYGVVTGVVADGFYLQDPSGDGDPRTSDGIFVYTYNTPTVQAGQCVELQRAYVDEFYEKTELSRLKAILPSNRCATTRITPVLIPQPRLGHAPETDYEQVEGMVVQLEPLTGVVQGPTKHFADGERELVLLPAKLLPYVEAGRVYQHDAAAMAALIYLTNGLGATLPEARHGDRVQVGVRGTLIPSKAQPIQAILDYNFGKYQLLLWPGTSLTLTSVIEERQNPEQTMSLAPDAFSVCSYNLHGMGRGSEQYWEPQIYDQQLAKRARTIAETLAGCTIIGLQELGTPADLDRLLALLDQGFGLSYTGAALPGPGTQSNEFPLTLGLIARSDHVTIQTADLYQGCSDQDFDVVRGIDDCAIGLFPLFNRPPLVVELAVRGIWPDEFPLTLIVNHWKSKGGDETINLVRRMAQARHVASIAQAQLAADSAANLIVLGDLNDYYTSEPVAILRSATNPSLIHTYDYLSPLDRYSYVFNGGSQVLDHLLVSPNLSTRIGHVDIVHVNADFPSGDNEQVALQQRSSDHDLVQLQIRPHEMGIVGGNLGYPGITVTLTSTVTFTSAFTSTSTTTLTNALLYPANTIDSSTVYTTVTDEQGDFRLWSVPIGSYEVHIDPSTHFNKLVQTGILSVTAGYQTISPVDVNFNIAEAEMLRDIVDTMATALQFVDETRPQTQ